MRRRLGVAAAAVVGACLLGYLGVLAATAGGHGGSGAAAATAGGAPASPTTAAPSTVARSAGRPTQLPVVAASPLKGIRYLNAPAEAQRFFAPAVASSGSLVVSSTVHAVGVGTQQVAAVADYRMQAGLAHSPVFRDQFAVQLIGELAHDAAAAKLVRLNGRSVAVSTGKVPLAGWFEGDHVVVVHRVSGSLDLKALALGVIDQPKGR